ncbi:membrane dipeptidase [Bradyrhizobium sp. CIR48]|uniref:dipeptidase n=1 Tax=Bradyrhizobium sp. CIR48 TaxID=2663840 RepID=UPI001606502E|nr:membrane dipeptidase [Bradyrhizobium sp. CIR48]MBB4423872.1 membrane dipeptidase [Bradyrhizobium sp. CIR48]
MSVHESSSDRLEQIHQQTLFVDMHAHPGGIHYPDVSRIGADELARYRRGLIDVIVCNVVGDATYTYVKPDGTFGWGNYRPKPGAVFAFDLDRISAILRTIDDDEVVLADSPAAVRAAKRKGKLALMPALEGADGLEGRIDNLHKLYHRGLRLLQLVHMRANEVGHIQTHPYSPGGLTSFGREVVRECNKLRIIIDLAHCNTETIMDTLDLSAHPVICSHTGVRSLCGPPLESEQRMQMRYDRFLTDEEIRAIAAKGGVIGIIPSGWMPNLSDLMRHFDHVRHLVGIDHLGLGSDRVGTGTESRPEPANWHTAEFGLEGNFRAISDGLLTRGYSAEEVGKVMGGNFFRVWEQVAEAH